MQIKNEDRRKRDFIKVWAKKIQCINYKGGKCIKCGETSPLKLAFHHTNPSEKNFEIGSSSRSLSFDILKKELDKCVLLCENCHREIHCNTADFYKYYDEILEKSKSAFVCEPKKVTDEEIIPLIIQGWSQRQIASKFNVSKTAIQYRIRQLIKKNKIDNSCKTKLKQNTPPLKYKKMDDDKLLMLLKEHKHSYHMISKIMNVCKSQVERGVLRIKSLLNEEDVNFINYCKAHPRLYGNFKQLAGEPRL
jgi:predicted transcriptional regulator